MAEQNLAQIVEKVFRNQGGWVRIKGELAVYYWPRIAGSELAAKVEAMRYRDGNLYLQTDNPALAHQVSMLNYDIIQRFQRILGRGVVKTIKIKIAPINPPVVKAKERVPVELAEADTSLINDCCNKIADTDLAGPFRNLMHQAITRNKRLIKEQGNLCQSCNTAIESEYSYCPCCERQIHHEIGDYLQYLQKSNQGIPIAVDSNGQLTELHKNLIQQILKQEHS